MRDRQVPDVARQIADLQARIGVLERRRTLGISPDGTLWQLVGTTLEPTEALVTSGGIDALDVELDGDVTLDSGGIVRISGDGGVAVSGNGSASIGDSNTGNGIAIAGTTIVVLADETLMRGMNAAPASITGQPAGTWAFWVDNTTWELKVQAHAGSGLLKNLTIGTLT